MPSKVWSKIDYPFPNFDEMEAKWIDDFISHPTMDAIAYPWGN